MGNICKIPKLNVDIETSKNKCPSSCLSSCCIKVFENDKRKHVKPKKDKK